MIITFNEDKTGTWVTETNNNSNTVEFTYTRMQSTRDIDFVSGGILFLNYFFNGKKLTLIYEGESFVVEKVSFGLKHYWS